MNEPCAYANSLCVCLLPMRSGILIKMMGYLDCRRLIDFKIGILAYQYRPGPSGGHETKKSNFLTSTIFRVWEKFRTLNKSVYFTFCACWTKFLTQATRRDVRWCLIIGCTPIRFVSQLSYFLKTIQIFNHDQDICKVLVWMITLPLGEGPISENPAPKIHIWYISPNLLCLKLPQ